MKFLYVRSVYAWGKVKNKTGKNTNLSFYIFKEYNNKFIKNLIRALLISCFIKKFSKFGALIFKDYIVVFQLFQVIKLYVLDDECQQIVNSFTLLNFQRSWNCLNSNKMFSNTNQMKFPLTK